MGTEYIHRPNIDRKSQSKRVGVGVSVSKSVEWVSKSQARNSQSQIHLQGVLQWVLLKKITWKWVTEGRVCGCASCPWFHTSTSCTASIVWLFPSYKRHKVEFRRVNKQHNISEAGFKETKLELQCTTGCCLQPEGLTRYNHLDGCANSTHSFGILIPWRHYYHQIWCI
jgi:hypothetical protein